MPQTFELTKYPPPKTLLVWDGECGFCKYWKIYLQNITSDNIEYEPFQEIAHKFTDIERKYFEDAVQLIDTEGKIYSGAHAAYRLLYISNKYSFLYKWYMNSFFFRNFSDKAYHWISENRPLMYKLTIRLFGKNPIKMLHYWIIYLVLLVLLILLTIAL